MAVIRHITLPAGFVAGATASKLKHSGKVDLAIIAATDGLVPTAVVTTQNQVVGAPVRWCRSVLPKGFGLTRGLVVNAGNSNVCNGKPGDRDAAEMAALAGKVVGAKAKEMLVCSTGVIGHLMPMDKVRKGIAALESNLDTRHDQDVAHAIMTTDLIAKSAVVQTRVAGVKISVAGIAKGSGMIAPSLATMLSFVTTDLAITPAALGKALNEVCYSTFNAITVDGDTSTSDTLIVMASGKAGNKPITGGAELVKFTKALAEVCGALAESIARDGEGASKLLRIIVSGARHDTDAMLAAKTIANSPLLKCAVHGGDPNWGRTLAAAGRSPAKVDQDKATCKIGGITVMRRGGSCPFDLKAVQKHMAGKDVTIELNLGLGKGKYTALTCDLSREYIAINADYHT